MNAEIPTIAEASALIAAKKLSPVELTRACLDRIEMHDGALNAFLRLAETDAMAAAHAAEDDIVHDRSKGLLHGIPLALKDIFDIEAVPTTAHSRLLSGYVPEKDAGSVRRLKDAGAIIIGKVALHEFALGGPSWDLPWPPARNPWNTDHQTGGSSSGSAVAVAAGFALGALGSDTGGSIRTPAAYCGIAGLKPTYGRVSRSGVFPLAYSLDHVGPMAWTVEDCAILLGAIAGYDATDPGSADKPIPEYADAIGRSIKGLRVGVVRHFHENDIPVSEATLRGIRAVSDTLKDAGAVVCDVELSPPIEWRAVGLLTTLVEGFTIHEPWLQTRLHEYGELLRDRLSLGGLISGADYVQAQRRRRELCDELSSLMRNFDVLVTATVMSEAPRLGEIPKWAMLDRPNFTSPFNISGFPAMSICTGYGTDGLPVAAQLVANPFDEETLFRAGHALERAWSGQRKRPSMVAGAAMQ
jgi:aspartyl-tRNA(Asn)/glutamyl-tRNA(Gln) amidotransferase subunit A